MTLSIAKLKTYKELNEAITDIDVKTIDPKTKKLLLNKLMMMCGNHEHILSKRILNFMRLLNTNSTTDGQIHAAFYVHIYKIFSKKHPYDVYTALKNYLFFLSSDHVLIDAFFHLDTKTINQCIKYINNSHMKDAIVSCFKHQILKEPSLINYASDDVVKLIITLINGCIISDNDWFIASSLSKTKIECVQLLMDKTKDTIAIFKQENVYDLQYT